MNDMQTLPFIGSLFASFLFSLPSAPQAGVTGGNATRRGDKGTEEASSGTKGTTKGAGFLGRQLHVVVRLFPLLFTSPSIHRSALYLGGLRYTPPPAAATRCMESGEVWSGRMERVTIGEAVRL